jgi:hypothetical protein
VYSKFKSNENQHGKMKLSIKDKHQWKKSIEENLITLEEYLNRR